MIKKTLLTISIFLMFILSVSLASAISFTTDELGNFWEFEEGSGTIAIDSTGGNNLDHDAAYAVTDTSRIEAGNFSLFFDGSTLADGGNLFDLDRGNNFSVISLINNTVTPSKMAITSNRFQSGSKNGVFFGVTVTGELNVEIRHANNNRIDIKSAQLIDNASWICVGFTYDGSSLANGTNLYIDGVQDNIVVADTLSDSIATSANFNIGATNGASEFFRGSIDNVALFRIELTQSQVQAICDEGITAILPPPEPPSPPELDFLSCPDTTTKALIFVLLSLMIGFFLILAIKTKVYFIGFFASVMLLIMSIFFAPCLQLFSFILAIIGLVFLVWFCFLGLVQNPFTGKR